MFKTEIINGVDTIVDLLTPAEITNMSAEDIAEVIVEICRHGRHIQNDAAFKLPRFMAIAGVRMADYILENKRATETVNTIYGGDVQQEG